MHVVLALLARRMQKLVEGLGGGRGIGRGRGFDGGGSGGPGN